MPFHIFIVQWLKSIATDMIEQGVDIYTVKEFLGHASLSMTERYVLVYLKSLKAKYDAYRVKKTAKLGIRDNEPNPDSPARW